MRDKPPHPLVLFAVLFTAWFTSVSLTLLLAWALGGCLLQAQTSRTLPPMPPIPARVRTAITQTTNTTDQIEEVADPKPTARLSATSARGSTVVSSGPRGIDVIWRDVPAGRARVLWSTNLVDWSPVGTLPRSMPGDVRLRDTTRSGVRWYRLEVAP